MLKNCHLIIYTILLFFITVSVMADNGSTIFHEDAFEGKVIDAETKGPIEGAVVVAIYNVSTFGDIDIADIQETLTDSNGEFHIPGNTFSYSSPLAVSAEKTAEKTGFIIFKPGYWPYPGINTFLIYPVKETLRKSDDTNVTKGREGIIFEKTMKDKDARKLYRKKFAGYRPFIPLENPIERIRNLDLPFDADVFKVERIYIGRTWRSYRGEPFKTYPLIGLPKANTLDERKKSHSSANKIPPEFKNKVPIWKKMLDDEYNFIFKGVR